jgi:hypothetical protein
MAKKSLSGSDLVWIFRERLAAFGERSRRAPIAIVPSKKGWKAVTSHRYLAADSELEQRIEKIQAELQTVYVLRR